MVVFLLLSSLLEGLSRVGVCLLAGHLLLEGHQVATAVSRSGKYLLIEVVLGPNSFRLVDDGVLWHLWLSELDMSLGDHLVLWLLRVRSLVFDGLFLLLWEVAEVDLSSRITRFKLRCRKSVQFLLRCLSCCVEILAACLEVIPSVVQVLLVPISLARVLLALVHLNSPLFARLLGSEVRVAC